MTFRRWDIWEAYVKFEDEPGGKCRPVLVLDEERCYVLSLKITSKPPRNWVPGEYPIRMWKAAGLDCQSTIRTTKRLRLVESDFRRKRGVLHPIDRAELKNYIGSF